MLVTSKEANKKLQQLESLRTSLLDKERETCTFLASVGEDVESCRPEYNYDEVKNKLETIENKVVKLKHAINAFNTTALVEGFNKTIDEMLINIPQLSRRKLRLEGMKQMMPKARESNNYRSTIIDYRYINFDQEKVNKDYDLVVEELSKAQIALDTVNVTKKFEIDD